MDPSPQGKIKFLSHHKQQSLCTTRPLYRQGRKLTAVKVYTVNDESVHLLIHGVPSIGLLSEVSMLCERYGRIKSAELVDQYSPDQEEFTNIYHVQFERIQSARFAKKILDNKSFFGGILHVCYAPELETVNETKLKLVNRKREIAKRSRLSNTSEIYKSSNAVTCDMDDDSFKTAYEDKVSLGINLKQTFNNSTIPGPSICFPSASQETNVILNPPSFIGPTVSSSDFNINLATASGANSSDSPLAQSAEKVEDLKILKAGKNKFSNPRKRQNSDFIIDAEPLGPVVLSGQMKCSEHRTSQDVKKKKVSKTWEALNKNFSNPLKRSYSGVTANTELVNLSIVTQQNSHPESSTTQYLEKKIFLTPKVQENIYKGSYTETNHKRSLGQSVAPQQVYSPKPSTSGEVRKTVISDKIDTASNNSPLKAPVIGSIRFIPRSLSIKKK